MKRTYIEELRVSRSAQHPNSAKADNHASDSFNQQHIQTYRHSSRREDLLTSSLSWQASQFIRLFEEKFDRREKRGN